MKHENEIERILKEREGNYGKFEDNALIMTNIFKELHSNETTKDAGVYNCTMMYLAGKLARLAYDNEHRDSIVDAIGYLQLYLDYLDSK